MFMSCSEIPVCELKKKKCQKNPKNLKENWKLEENLENWIINRIKINIF